MTSEATLKERFNKMNKMSAEAKHRGFASSSLTGALNSYGSERRLFMYKLLRNFIHTQYMSGSSSSKIPWSCFTLYLMNSPGKFTGTAIDKKNQSKTIQQDSIMLSVNTVNNGSKFSVNGWTVTEGQCFAIDSTKIPLLPAAGHIADHTWGGETVRIFGSNTKFGQSGSDARDIVFSMDELFKQIGNILPKGGATIGPAGGNTRVRDTSGRGNNCLFHAIWQSYKNVRLPMSPVSNDLTWRHHLFYNSWKRFFGIPIGDMMDLTYQLHGPHWNCISTYAHALNVRVTVHNYGQGNFYHAATINPGSPNNVDIVYYPHLYHYQSCW